MIVSQRQCSGETQEMVPAVPWESQHSSNPHPGRGPAARLQSRLQNVMKTVSHSCQMLLSIRQNMLAMCVRAWEKVCKGNKMTLCWEKGRGWGPCAVDGRTLAVLAVFVS